MADSRRGKVYKTAVSVVICVVAVAMLVAGSAIGRFFKPPAWVDESDAVKPIEVWVPIEVRDLDLTRSGPGVARIADKDPIILAGLDQPAVLLRIGPKVGEQLRPGFLAEVSGKPYFLLSGPLGVYRDLSLGQAGLDVQFLQEALTRAGFAVPATGKVGSLTMGAMRDLFGSAGYRLPQREVPIPPKESRGGSSPPSVSNPTTRMEEYIPVRQLVALPQSGAISSLAQVGARIDDSTAVVTLIRGSDFVEFVADVEWSGKLKQGAQLSIAGPMGANIGAKVVSVGKFEEGKDGAPSGYRVRASLDAGDLAKARLQPNDAVTVRQVEVVKNATVIPLAALRSDSGGSFVYVKADKPLRKAVTVSASAAGYVAVSGDIAPGDQVLMT